ncbi:MAG: transcriptional regulator [Candidatus Thorarchaeota archaeon]
MSKKYEDFIYPEEIRKYEKQLYEFIVESGKNKRRSEIESHILGYFLLHSSLTQKEIQILSTKFRSRRISSGSISTFLNQYTSYEPRVILKEKIPDSKNKFRYHTISENIKEMFAVAKEAGVNVLSETIRKLEEILRALDNLKPNEKDIKLYNIILERIKELIDYLEYHLSLLDNFMQSAIGKKYSLKKDIKTQKKNLKVRVSENLNLKDIEKALINLILNNEIFIIEEMKYHPIIAYLITRKSLTQLELKKLTGLSAGLISEGLNYLKKQGYIEIQKLQGVRQKKYVLESVGYFNFLKFYQRFKNIVHNKYRLSQILDELEKRKDKLGEKNGYKIIKTRVKEFLDQYRVVDFGIKIFQKALEDFKKSG